MSWEDYARKAQVGGGGEIPDIPDDLYDAIIKDVSEVAPSTYEGKEQQRFFITWEITSGDAKGESVRQYVTLPEAYLNDGYVNEKSHLYGVMDGLGFDMTGQFTVEPWKWQGMEARILLEQKRAKDGTPEKWPKVTAVKQTRRSKQPGAAGARPARRTDPEWDE